MTNTTHHRPAEMGQARRRPLWLWAACVAGCGLSALGVWVLAVSWFGSPEQLFSLSPTDRKMLADHDRRIEDLRELVLGRRQVPPTAVEGHVEAIELQRLVFHGAEKDPSRADSALMLMGLIYQRPLVARLQQEKVGQAREQDRVVGFGLVGSAFALVGWAVRRWREAGRSKGGQEHTPAQAEPHNRAVNVIGSVS